MSALIDMYDDAIYKLSQENAKLREALEMAKTGLVWYMENTDQSNGCDDDALAQIDEALAKDKQ